MPAPPRILVVDDDSRLREVVTFALSQAGLSVEEAGDGAAALTLLAAKPYAAVVLDVVMPELDGLEVCRRLRQSSRIPILFLSSRDDEVDRILGLELGGDDYLTKPFSPRELVARVKALLRRAQPVAPAAPSEGALRRGKLVLDAEQWRAFYDGAEVVLTVTEFNLLATFLRAPTKAFTRDELISRVYDGVVVSDRTIDSHVRRIRHKLAAAGGEVIETVHGLGYRLALD